MKELELDRRLSTAQQVSRTVRSRDAKAVLIPCEFGQSNRLQIRDLSRVCARAAFDAPLWEAMRKI